MNRPQVPAGSTSSVSMDVDQMVASIERCRRKQLEVVAGILESDTLRSLHPKLELHHIGIELAFLRGQLDFGRQILRHRNSDDEQAAAASMAMAQPMVQPAGIASTPRDAKQHPAAVSVPQRYEFEGPDISIHAESVTGTQAAAYGQWLTHPNHHLLHPSRHPNVPLHASWTDSESLLDSHQTQGGGMQMHQVPSASMSRSVSTNGGSVVTNRYHHHLAGATSAIPSRSPSATLAEKATRAKYADYLRPATNRASVATTPTVNHLNGTGGTASVSVTHMNSPAIAHRCCALGVDVWRVRRMMHLIEEELVSTEVEAVIVEEHERRLATVQRDEVQERVLIETMFFASMPLHRVTRRVCNRVLQLEGAWRDATASCSMLQDAAESWPAQKQQVIAQLTLQHAGNLEEIQRVVELERSTAHEVIAGLSQLAYDATIDAEGRQRAAIQELELSEFRNLLLIAAFTPVTNLVVSTTADSSVVSVQNWSLFHKKVFWVANEHQLRSETTVSNASVQTVQGGDGRWLSGAEELQLRSVWFTQLQTQAMIATLFFTMLEESERARLEAEEDDRFARDHATWQATRQHFLRLRDVSVKDAQIAALQLDLAAMRGASANHAAASQYAATSRSSSVNADGFGNSVVSGASSPGPLAPSLRSRMAPNAVPQPLVVNVTPTSSPLELIPVATPRVHANEETPLVHLHPTNSLSMLMGSLGSGGARGARPTFYDQNPLMRSGSNARFNASVEGSFGSERTGYFESLRRSLSPPLTSEGTAAANRQSLSTPLITSTSRVPPSMMPMETMPGMNFPSVPMVVSMACTLEDLGREDIYRREVQQRRSLLAAFDAEWPH